MASLFFCRFLLKNLKGVCIFVLLSTHFLFILRWLVGVSSAGHRFFLLTMKITIPKLIATAMAVIALVGYLIMLLAHPTEYVDTHKADSLALENEILQSKADELKRQVSYKEREVDSLKSKKNDIVVRYKTLRDESTDTLFVYVADSLNEVNNEIIDTLERGLSSCKRVVALQGEQIRNDSIAMVEYTDIIKYQTATITRLGEKTWWDRNKLWIGIVGGLVVGGVGISLVK